MEIKTPFDYKFKLIKCGSRIFELYEYSNIQGKNYPQLKSKTIFPQRYIRVDNANRTKQNIKRLILSNLDMDKFITLTFNTDKTELSQTSKIFNNFIKRLKRVYPQLKYIAVPEFQKVSKRVHYHILCNIPYTKNNIIAEIWKNGFTTIIKIKPTLYISLYLIKYISKCYTDTRLFSKRKVLYSRNLIRPLVQYFYDYSQIKTLIHFLKIFSNITNKYSYCNKYIGDVNWNYYELPPELRVV